MSNQPIVFTPLLPASPSVPQPRLPGSLIQAHDDESSLRTWLARYEDSPATWDNYRKEAERIFLWSRSQGKTFAELTHEDTLAFRNFLKNPGPDWIARNDKGIPTKYPRQDPRWRPFVGPMSIASVKQSLRIVNGLFGWLVNARYLPGNPFALERRRSKKGKPRLTRHLLPEDVALILRTILQLPNATPRDRMHQARSRWLFVLFYLSGMRISEVASLRMEDFFSAKGTDGKTRWWANFTGKGDKDATQPVTSELLHELRSYRLTMGLSPLPAPGEDLPAVLRIGTAGRTKPMDRSGLHAIIKTIVRHVGDDLRAQGNPDKATVFEAASAHWMRHAMGSSLGNKGVSMQVIRDLLRHESVSTTNIYVHTEEEALHDQLERIHKLPGGDGT